MESHPDRDNDLANVVDELEENVTGEIQAPAPTSEPEPTEGAKQEPPD